LSRDALRTALEDANVRAFLAVIDLGEHGPNADDPDRYRTMYGGGKFDAPPWEHPRRKVTAGAWTSTAAGRGQFLAGTWDGLVKQYAFPDFSPECQNEAMVALVSRRGALDDAIEGRFDEAIAKCAKEWASLPGSPYGQPTMTLDQARRRYIESGGQFEATAFNPDSLETEHYDQPEAPMAPIVLPLLQIAAQFLPQLAEKFGSGSEVSNRNLAAGKVLADAIVTATNSPNLQAAVEKMASDPDAVKAAKAAVAQEWPELFEVSGGIPAARKLATDSEGPWYRQFLSIPFAVIVMLMPIIYFVIYHVITGTGWTQEIKASVVSAVISGVLFAIVGFALGTSFGSQRKTNLLANKE